MSLAPHVMLLRQGIKMGPGTLVDSMIHDGLTDAMENIHMGITAENLVEQYKISREEQDAYAVKSQNRAEEAQKNGFFDKEIVPVEIKDRKGTQIFNKDEYIKPGSTVEGIQKLRATFKEVCFIKYFEIAKPINPLSFVYSGRLDYARQCVWCQRLSRCCASRFGRGGG